MKYINTKTGNIIETPGVISGGDWKPVKKDRAPNESKNAGQKGAKAQDQNEGADKT